MKSTTIECATGLPQIIIGELSQTRAVCFPDLAVLNKLATNSMWPSRIDRTNSEQNLLSSADTLTSSQQGRLQRQPQNARPLGCNRHYLEAVRYVNHLSLMRNVIFPCYPSSVLDQCFSRTGNIALIKFICEAKELCFRHCADLLAIDFNVQEQLFLQEVTHTYFQTKCKEMEAKNAIEPTVCVNLPRSHSPRQRRGKLQPQERVGGRRKKGNLRAAHAPDANAHRETDEEEFSSLLDLTDSTLSTHIDSCSSSSIDNDATSSEACSETVVTLKPPMSRKRRHTVSTCNELSANVMETSNPRSSQTIKKTRSILQPLAHTNQSSNSLRRSVIETPFLSNCVAHAGADGEMNTNALDSTLNKCIFPPHDLDLLEADTDSWIMSISDEAEHLLSLQQKQQVHELQVDDIDIGIGGSGSSRFFRGGDNHQEALWQHANPPMSPCSQSSNTPPNHDLAPIILPQLGATQLGFLSTSLYSESHQSGDSASWKAIADNRYLLTFSPFCDFDLIGSDDFLPNHR